MLSHIRLSFYVGLSRNTDSPDLPARVMGERSRAVARYFASAYESCTIRHADGYWKGSPESTVVAEVIVPDEPAARAKARDVAARLAVLHKQEAIALVIEPVTFSLLGPDDLPSVFHGRYARLGASLESLHGE